MAERRLAELVAERAEIDEDIAKVRTELASTASEHCETCGDGATQWDYDQMMYFCDRHVQQADLTVPLEGRVVPKEAPNGT